MFISRYEDCEEFVSTDNTVIRELFHPDKAELGPVNYSLAHARLAPGCSTDPHRLKTSEVFYIMGGTGLARIDGEETEVGPATAIYVPPGASQNITNIGSEDLTFLCIVEPAWRIEDEEIL